MCTYKKILNQTNSPKTCTRIYCTNDSEAGEMMPDVTLYTGKYQAECGEWLRATPGVRVIAEGCSGQLAWYQAGFAVEDTGLLVDFLHQLLMGQNPLYNRSPKLRQMAKDTVFRQCREGDADKLARYLEENAALHVEGYIQFRLYEESCALNLLLYSLARRIQRKGENK